MTVWNTLRRFRRPSGIPYGSERSGEIGGRFEGRRAPSGGSRRPTIQAPCPYGGSSCAFANDRSPGKWRPYRRLRSGKPMCAEPHGFPAGSAKTLSENPQVTGQAGKAPGICRRGPLLLDELRKSCRTAFGRMRTRGEPPRHLAAAPESAKTLATRRYCPALPRRWEEHPPQSAKEMEPLRRYADEQGWSILYERAARFVTGDQKRTAAAAYLERPEAENEATRRLLSQLSSDLGGSSLRLSQIPLGSSRSRPRCRPRAQDLS